MKVKCALCGTKFNLEANNSICPNCAFHYHVDGESQRSFYGQKDSYQSLAKRVLSSSSSEPGFVQEKMRQEKIEDFIDDMQHKYEKHSQSTSYDMHKDIKEASHHDNPFSKPAFKGSYANNSNTVNVSRMLNVRTNNTAHTSKTTGSSLKKILLFLIASSIILFIVIFILAVTLVDATPQQEETSINDYVFEEDTPTYGPVHDSIGFDCGIMTIDEMAIESDEVWDEIEGYKLISLKYTFQSFDSYNDSAECIDLYLVTHSGEYLIPVQRYALDEDTSLDIYSDIDGVYTVCDDIYYEQGVMYFAVKEEDVASIFINEYDDNGEFIESYNITNVEEFIVEE